MTINTTSLVGIQKYAVNLDYPSSKATGVNFSQVTGVNASAGLTTLLSVTGQKGVVTFARIQNLTAETITIKLTVDSVVVWNDTYTAEAIELLIGNNSATAYSPPDTPCFFNDSFLLQLQTASDTSVDFDYKYRPLL